MADTDLQPPAPAVSPRRSGQMVWLAAAGLAALAIGLAWAERIDIAHQVIDRQIRQLKLSARYHIDEVGTGREVLSDISLGDPAKPDLVIKTLEVQTGWSDGLPAITGLTVVGAKLRGTSRNGHLSFGTLDSYLFAPTRAPFRLPDMALSIRDSVASIDGDYGPIGMAISGNGNLRDGFAGVTAAVAPGLRFDACLGHAASYHARIIIRHEQSRLIGPLRMAQLSCAGSALAVQAPVVQLDARIAPTFDGGTAHFGLVTGAARLGALGAARLAGSGGASLRSAVLAGNFTAAGDAVYGRSFVAGQLGLAGHLRARVRDGTLQGDGTLSGRGLAPDGQALAMLTRAANGGAGTMAAPLLAALRSGITRETLGSRLSGSWIVHRSTTSTSLVLPEAHVDGGHTTRWLSLSRGMLQQTAGAAGFAVAGDFAFAGQGFPQLRGQIRPLADGAMAATLAMPAWTAGTTSVALPVLAAHWKHGGSVGFAGRVVLSGPVPGGQVTGLTIPLQGSWSAGSGMAIGDRCTPVGFDRLTFKQLTLGRANGAANALTLCPGSPGGAIVAYSARGLRIAARAPGLSLDGRIGGSSVKITTGAAALTWPGTLSVNAIDIATTDAAAAGGHLQLAQLTTSLGVAIAGQFTGGDASLGGTPVAVRSASGAFEWANGALALDGAAFRIEDPAPQPNFAPIVAHDVTLAMANGAITGAASLRATAADRELARVTFTHDLASGIGHADLAMPGLVFDKALQPRQLSALTEGVIADANGTLTGHGSFNWDQNHVTSSGRLSTRDFDFAAAFGPVKGVSGTIAFTDLLGLVTAPDQKLAIAAINPGIEVDDGILTFALQPGHVLVVKGARWPFLDGQLVLLPTRLVLGATEVRRYELRVDGLNAAKFLARMDLSNLAATGTFDGNLPLVFDETGGRIVNGRLVARAPGGTVAYVGELTYKDLSPMANYAFRALRALKYRQMRIGMDGALAGNVVTHVSMQGVGQAKGARRNFITNQIARLPIQFDVNINAPFMQLVTSFRSLYDPAMVADPRTLGLIDAQGRAVAHPAPGKLPAAQTPPPIPPPAIQP